MRVELITIRNILGIDELEIRPGACTVVSGRNGVGKTSVIEAVKAVVGGGHDATLLRKGADAGEIVILMDDGMRIRKRVTAAGSRLTAHHESYGPLKAAQTWLKSATDRVTINPVTFLTDPKRGDRLLEALPMEPDADRLAAMLAEVGMDLPEDALAAGHALLAIAAVRKAVFAERSHMNRTVRDAKGSVRQLRNSLPERPDGDAADVEGLSAALERRKRARDEALTRAKLMLQDKLHTIDADARDQLAELERQFSAGAKVVQEKATAARDAARAEHDTSCKVIVDASADEIAAGAGKVEAARTWQRVERSYQQVATLLEAQETLLQEATSHALLLTDMLKSLDAVRDEYAADLPVDGLEIADGAVSVHGIPFERMNKAAQVELAVEVAKLRAREIPLVCMDGLEALDAERFDLLANGLAEAGLQAIVTRVSDDETLTIERQPDP